MKVPLTFIALLFLGALFLGFEDVKTAQQKAIPVEELTPEQELNARKNVTLYETYYHDYFAFSDDKIKLPTLIYDLSQYLIILALTYMLWERSSPEEFKYVAMFFFFTVADLADYFLTHNGIYFYIQGVPVTWNTLSILFYSSISICIHFYGSSTGNV